MSKPFVLELDDLKIEFPVHKVKEYEALQEQVALSIRNQNRMLADELSFGPMERARFLKDSDLRSISVSEVETFLADDRNARRVLRSSLAKTGKNPADAEAALEKIDVSTRYVLARHVAGVINLDVTPEEDRKLSEKAKAIIRAKFPGTDPDELMVKDFYALLEQLAPPAKSGPEGWFEANTVAGTSKPLAIAS